MRSRLFLLLSVLWGSSYCVFGQDSVSLEELRQRPISNVQGEAGNLLRQWWKEGTAAGNIGDWYDNRDREHSPFKLDLYPQLQKIKYTPADNKADRNWGLQPKVLPLVVLGNSSTSGLPNLNGSNVRIYYTMPAGLDLLQQQYLRNNLYIYPEHRDYDPGRSDVGGGYGDLYPTNTPYLITSQGSSYTDQPFMQAVAMTMAAFRPEVKKKLIETGLLMPTIQMVFRSSNKQVRKAEDYFTGSAHPPVFEGTQVDLPRMLKLAHSLQVDSLPPAIKLDVVEEDRVRPGADYFEAPGLTETLGNTVSVIARVFRGRQKERRMVVRVRDSLDLNGRPLTFRWVLLRGDEGRVSIKTKDAKGTEAEIKVDYQERRPIAPGSPMETNRVDIGVFAHNGVHPSAPGFITFFSLDQESRDYDSKGQIREIAYGDGATTFKVPVIAELASKAAQPGLINRLLKLTPQEGLELTALVRDLGPVATESSEFRKRKQTNAQQLQKTTQAIKTLEKQLAALNKNADPSATNEILAPLIVARSQQKSLELESAELTKRLTAVEPKEKAIASKASKILAPNPSSFLLSRLEQSLANPERIASLSTELEQAYRQSPPARQQKVDAAWKKLVQLGYAAPAASGKLQLAIKPDEKPTAFRKSMVREYLGVLWNELIAPDLVVASFVPHFVDVRLTGRKFWRDEYWQENGVVQGWKRYHYGVKPRVEEFTENGFLVLGKDADNRPIKVQTVRYQHEKAVPPTEMNFSPLLQLPGEDILHLSYRDGKAIVQRREKAAIPKK